MTHDDDKEHGDDDDDDDHTRRCSNIRNIVMDIIWDLLGGGIQSTTVTTTNEVDNDEYDEEKLPSTTPNTPTTNTIIEQERHHHNQLLGTRCNNQRLATKRQMEELVLATVKWTSSNPSFCYNNSGTTSTNHDNHENALLLNQQKKEELLLSGKKLWDLEIRTAPAIWNRYIITTTTTTPRHKKNSKEPSVPQQKQQQHVLDVWSLSTGVPRRFHSALELSMYLLPIIETICMDQCISTHVRVDIKSTFICLVTVQRAKLLLLSHTTDATTTSLLLPCPVCPQWCRGKQGLWWHVQKQHNTHHGIAQEMARTQHENSLAMVLYQPSPCSKQNNEMTMACLLQPDTTGTSGIVTLAGVSTIQKCTTTTPSQQNKKLKPNTTTQAVTDGHEGVHHLMDTEQLMSSQSPTCNTILKFISSSPNHIVNNDSDHVDPWQLVKSGNVPGLIVHLRAKPQQQQHPPLQYVEHAVGHWEKDDDCLCCCHENTNKRDWWDPYTARDKNGANALLWAAGSGHLSMVQYLVEQCGLDPNQGQELPVFTSTTVRGTRGHDSHQQDDDNNNNNNQGIVVVVNNNRYKKQHAYVGRTALHWACRHGHVDIVKYLLQSCHVNVHATTYDETTAFHWAAWQGHINILDLLWCHCSNTTSIETTGDEKHIESTTLQLIQHRNTYGCHAALWAAQGSNRDCVVATMQWLSEPERGCPLWECNESGHSVLHKAAQRGHVDLCHWLVQQLCEWAQQHDDAFHRVQGKDEHDLVLRGDAVSSNYPIFIQVLGPDREGCMPSDLAGMAGMENLAVFLAEWEGRIIVCNCHDLPNNCSISNVTVGQSLTGEVGSRRLERQRLAIPLPKEWLDHVPMASSVNIWEPWAGVARLRYKILQVTKRLGTSQDSNESII